MEDGPHKVRMQLKEMQKLSQVPVRSIRRSLFLEEPDLALKPAFNDSMKVLVEEFGLPFEIDAGQDEQYNRNALKFA